MLWGEVGNFGECELKMVSSASKWGNKVRSSSMRENMLEDFTGLLVGLPTTGGLPLVVLWVKHVSWRV
jgi:hypothetical protein